MKKVIAACFGMLAVNLIAGHVFAQALPRPNVPDNKVVAHRGGAMETGIPDNSMEALNYTIGLGCYAAECDVYITKDNRIVVAHADKEGKINGVFPWEATFDEIVAAQKLPNGEVIPSLEEYLDRIIEARSTMLWIDVKYLSSLPKEKADELACRAVEVASDIVRKKRAQHFVEVITPLVEVHEVAVKAANGEWPCGLMDTKRSPEWFRENGYDWANFENSKVFYFDGETKGAYTIDDYLDNGVQVSIYHVDTDLNRDYYVGRLDDLHALTTNYPAALLAKIKERKEDANE